MIIRLLIVRLLVMRIIRRRILMSLETIVRFIAIVLNQTLVLKTRHVIVIMLVLMETLVRLNHFINILLNSIFHFLVDRLHSFIEH